MGAGTDGLGMRIVGGGMGQCLREQESEGGAEGLPCSTRSPGLGFRVLGVGFRVQGSGFRGVAVHDELRHGFADLQRDLLQYVPG